MEDQKVLAFWFDKTNQPNWFKKDSQFDETIHQEFGQLLQQASQGETASFRETLRGRLAEIIVLDQFSRNVYRDIPAAFAQDGMALVLAQEAIKLPERATLTPEEKSFLYMPFMHSESPVIHQEALRLFSEPGLEMNLEFEKKHAEIIQRFGRYPHRNQILGRQSTAAEIEFLKGPNSSF